MLLPENSFNKKSRLVLHETALYFIKIVELSYSRLTTHNSLTLHFFKLHILRFAATGWVAA